MTTPAPKSGGSKKWLWIVLGVVGLLLVMVVCCCGGMTTCSWMAKKRVEEDFKKASATLGEEGATRALSGGRISTNGLPSSFPSDVPEPRGGKVTGSVDGSKDVKTAGWVAFTTSDSMSDAANYYVTKMTANGWERVNSMDTTEARSLVFKKNSNTVSITINNGTPTTVMITYASE